MIKKILIFGINNTGEKIYKKLNKFKKYKIKLILKSISLKEVKSFKPDYIFSLGYRKKIKNNILKLAKEGCFNIHKSLLPLHSGANPVFWTIKNSTKAGHTIHLMNQNIDQGDIVFQKVVDYDFSYDAKKLYQKIEKQQVKDFFIFLKNINYFVSRKKKNKFNKKNFHFKKDFQKYKKINYFLNNDKKNVLNLIRALNFEPFNNINFMFNKKYYNFGLKIKKINKFSKNKFNKIKEYEYQK